VKQNETAAGSQKPPRAHQSVFEPAPGDRRPGGDHDRVTEPVLAAAGLGVGLLLLAGAVLGLVGVGVSGWRAVPTPWPWWTNVLVIAALASSVVLFGLIVGTLAVRLKDAAASGLTGGRSREAFRSGSLPPEFERMSGAEFENEVAELLRGLGYSVRPTPPSSIHDVDLLLETAGRKVAVQLKRWNAPVGDRAVYAAFVGRIHHGTDEAWLITTSRFTSKAVKLAKTTGVRLVDGAELAGWLGDRREEE
jgi:Restriction endonuclease